MKTIIYICTLLAVICGILAGREAWRAYWYHTARLAMRRY